jgi:hypothetical protein
LNGSTFAHSPSKIVLELLLMQVGKFATKKRQIKICAHKSDNYGQAKSAQIDWPILTFWLTYFGIMFAILCGLISAGT